MSMEMCDDRHEPVVYTKYDNRNKFHKCPVCEALDRVAEIQDENVELANKIGDLKAENKALNKENDNYQKMIDAEPQEKP